MTSFNAGSIEASLDLDVDPFQRGIDYARTEARKFAGEKYEAKLGVDAAGFRGELAAARAELVRLATGTYTARVDLNGGAQMVAQLNMIARQLADIDRTRATPSVDLRGGAAVLAELQLIEARLNALGRGNHTANIGANTGGLTAGLGAAGGRMQTLIALGVALGPALIPGLVGATAAAGGLTSALMAAGGALGVLAVAGIGNVMQVTGAQKDLEKATTAVTGAAQAAAAAQQQAGAAARGVQAAETALADARRSAAQSVAAAEQQVGVAQRGVRTAQDALNRARKEAAERLEDYRDQLRGAALDEEGAEIAVRRAFQSMQDALRDPASTDLDRDEARQAYQEALFNLDQVRESRDDLQKQAQKDRKAGVEGSNEVRAARDRLRQANEQLADARRGVDDAEEAGARQVAAARLAVADANRNAAAAAAAAGTASTALAAAEADRAKALRTLSTPAAQAFTAALEDAKAAWGEFLAATRDSSLGVATRGLQLFAKYLPDLAPVADAAAEGVGRLFDRLDGWLESGGMKGIVDFLSAEGPDMIESFGVILGNLGRWFGGVAVAFAPFARRMMNGLEDLTDSWADWANELDNSDGFEDFIDYALEYGPLFLDTLGSMWDAVVNIGKALAPAGVASLKVLRSVFDTIGELDPTTLAALIGVGGVILAFTAAPVAGTALAIVGLVAAVGSLAEDSPALADALGGVGDVMGVVWDWGKKLASLYGDEVKKAWKDIQPDLEKVAQIVNDDLKPALEEFWEGNGGRFLRWWATVEGKRAGLMIRFVGKGLVAMAAGLVATLEMLNGAFSGDWNKFWNGLRRSPAAVLFGVPVMLATMTTNVVGAIRRGPIGRTWSNMWDGIQRRAGRAREAIIGTLVRGRDSLMHNVRVGMAVAMNGIEKTWNRLQRIAGTPTKFLVDTVYSKGIKPVVDAIPGVGDLPSINTSKWPSYDRGGYTGRGTKFEPAGIVHKDEFVFTKEATNGNVGLLEQLHEQLRSRSLRGYAGGGRVWPLPGARASTYAGHDGVDFNVGSGSDDLGLPFYAAAAGKVSSVGYARGYGNAVFVRGPYGELVYGHALDGSIMVAPDQPVAAGQMLARVGNTGNSSAPHLHFGFPSGSYGAAMAFLNGATTSGYGGGVGGGGSFEKKQNPLQKFAGAIKGAASFAKTFPTWMSRLDAMGGWGPMMGDAARSIGRSTAEYVNKKIPDWGPIPNNPIPTGIFDQGGWLNPGSAAINMGATPEPVLTDAQWRAVSQVALSGTSGLSAADVDRIVKAIEDNRGVYAHVSSREDLEAAAAAINRKMREP